MSDDEFYIGYEPVMPEAIGRRVRMVVAAMAAIAVGVGALVTAAQRPLADASFAYGRVETWHGYLVRTPAPALLVPRGAGFERVWLVGRGKHGAEAVLGTLGAEWVAVHGSEIERHPWRMVEVAHASATTKEATLPRPSDLVPDRGRAFRARGEIVDSKCFLGVMNPGERTVHRDCAIRCLSGGVTPMLSFTDDAGQRAIAVLVDREGLVPPADLTPWVGRQVEVAGRLHTLGDVMVLQLESVSGGES